MMAPVDLFGGVTREDIRAQKRKEMGEEEEKVPVTDQVGNDSFYNKNMKLKLLN